MEGEDISPAFANASSFAVDPNFNGATNFFFGSEDSAGGATLTPTQTDTATATATSAPNSPASAASLVNPTYVTPSTATGTTSLFAGLSTTTLLLLLGAGLIVLHFFHRN